jgi:hypothetical protein
MPNLSHFDPKSAQGQSILRGLPIHAIILIWGFLNGCPPLNYLLPQQLPGQADSRYHQRRRPSEPYLFGELEDLSNISGNVMGYRFI